MAFPGDVPWMQYFKTIRREAEIVRYYGGHYATYAFNRSGNNLYNYLCQYALRAHQMVSYSGPGREWLSRSATLFSRLLWDDSLTTWRGAAEKITVSAGRDVWWQDFAAVGDSPDCGTRYVIHLFNAPGAPTTLAVPVRMPLPTFCTVKVRSAVLPTKIGPKLWLAGVTEIVGPTGGLTVNWESPPMSTCVIPNMAIPKSVYVPGTDAITV